MKLKDAIIQAPILRYPDTTKPYILYTDASNDTCGAQLSQIHNKTKFLVAFLLHTFTDTQWRWSTPEQEAYGIYFAIKKWNYYLQGADIIVMSWPENQGILFFLYFLNIANEPDIFHGFPP